MSNQGNRSAQPTLYVWLRASLLLLLLFLSSTSLFAQMRVLRGVLRNAENNGIEGVEIMVKASRERSVSDQNGRFQLSGVRPNDILQFSHVSYEPLSLPAKAVLGDSVVRLEERVVEMDKVLVRDRSQYTKRKTLGHTSTGWRRYSFGVFPRLAVYIANPRQREALIESIGFRAGNVGKSDVAGFRVCILRVNRDSLYPGPDTLLSEQRIVGSALKRKTIHNVLDKGVYLPPEGAFIILRKIKDPKLKPDEQPTIVRSKLAEEQNTYIDFIAGHGWWEPCNLRCWSIFTKGTWETASAWLTVRYVP